MLGNAVPVTETKLRQCWPRRWVRNITEAAAVWAARSGRIILDTGGGAPALGSIQDKDFRCGVVTLLHTSALLAEEEHKCNYYYIPSG